MVGLDSVVNYTHNDSITRDSFFPNPLHIHAYTVTLLQAHTKNTFVKIVRRMPSNVYFITYWLAFIFSYPNCHLYLIFIRQALHACQKATSDTWHMPPYPTRKDCMTNKYCIYTTLSGII